MASNKNYYPGQKNIPGLIHKIINQIPECKFFFEPFAGSAAVSRFLSVHSPKAIYYRLNDIDKDLMYNYVDISTFSVITHDDASEYIQRMIKIIGKDYKKETFFFIDPPYLQSTRANTVNLYKYELSDVEHLQLLNTVRDLKSNCMITHPSCSLYDTHLKDWRVKQITVRYHQKTDILNLYMNYPEPEKLCVSVYTGSDCWDRQRIKRKGDRLISKIEALPAKEKNYILTRIAEKFIQ